MKSLRLLAANIVGAALAVGGVSCSWAQSCGAISPAQTQLANALASTVLSPMDGENYQHVVGGLVFTPKRGTGQITLPMPLGVADLNIKAKVTLVNCAASAGSLPSLSYVVVEAGINDLIGKVVPNPLDEPLRALNPGGAVLVFNLADSEIKLDKIHSSLLGAYRGQVGTNLDGVTVPKNGMALLMSADARDIMEKTAGTFLSGSPGKVRIQFQHQSANALNDFRMTLLGRFALKLAGVDNLQLENPAFIVTKEGAKSSTTFSGRFLFNSKAIGTAAVTKTAAGYSAAIALDPLDLGVFSIGGIGAPGPNMGMDLGSGVGTLTGQLTGSGPFSTVNARVDGTITPTTVSLRANANLLGSATLEFKGATMASFFPLGQGVNMAASIDSPNFASSLTNMAGNQVGASGLFNKAAGLIGGISPYPTITRASLNMSMGGSNPGGNMSVTGNVFRESFTSGDVGVRLSDLATLDSIAGKMTPVVVAKAEDILAGWLRDLMKDPIKLLSGLLGKGFSAVSKFLGGGDNNQIEARTVSIGGGKLGGNGSAGVKFSMISICKDRTSNRNGRVCECSGKGTESCACWVNCDRDGNVEFYVTVEENGRQLFTPAHRLVKSHGNSVEIRRGWNQQLCIDSGDYHSTGCSNNPNDPRIGILATPKLWVNQAPDNTIRDARQNFACAPLDRPGVGRAYQNQQLKRWVCEFGHDGREHTYTSNFVFLKIDPQSVEWRQGVGPESIGSLTDHTPICRAIPGSGWSHMEFGWVYSDGCVLGWGGHSPSIPQYETLIKRAPR